MSSPTQRTLKELRKRGYPLVQIVEHWNPFAHIRQDLFTIIDVLSVSPAGEVLAIQCTSGDHVAERVAKITDSDALPILRMANWRVMVWGWRKNSKGRYVLREVDLS